MGVITTEEIRLALSGANEFNASLSEANKGLDGFGRSAGAAGASLEQMEAALGGSKRAAKKAAEQARVHRDALDQQAKAAKYTRDSLGRLRDENGRFVGDGQRAAGATQEFSGAIGGLNKGFKKLAASIATLVSVGALVGQFQQGVQLASDFERGVANVNTLLDAGSVPIEKYRAQLRGLAKESSKDLLDLTTGLYQAISAGVPAVQGAGGAFEVLAAGQKAAVAGLAETREGVDAIVTVFNAYQQTGISAAEISDKLFTTVKRGRTTFNQLSGSLGTVASTASTFGVSLDELLAQVATLTRAGFGVEEAVTSIQATILGLSSPSKAVSKLSKQMGLDLSAAGIQANGFAETLKQIRQATGGSADAMAELFPNVRALRGMMVLTGTGAEGLANDLTALADAAGATDEAHGKIKETFSETAAIFKSQLQDTYIAAVERTMPRLQRVLEDVGAYLVENQDKIGRSVDRFVAGVISVGEFIARHGDSMVRFVKVFFAVSLIKKADAAILAFNTHLGTLGATAAGAGASVGDGLADGIERRGGRVKKALTAMLRSPGLMVLAGTAGVEIGAAVGKAIGEAMSSEWREQVSQIKSQIIRDAAAMRKLLKLKGFASHKEHEDSNNAIFSGRALRIDGKGVSFGALAGLEPEKVQEGFQDTVAEIENRIQNAEAMLEGPRAKLNKLAAQALDLQRKATVQPGMLPTFETTRADTALREINKQAAQAEEALVEREKRLQQLIGGRQTVVENYHRFEAKLITQNDELAAKAAIARKKEDEERAADLKKRAKEAEKRAKRAAQEAKAMIQAFKAGIGAAGLPSRVSAETRMAFGQEIERRAMGLPTEEELQARYKLEAEAVEAHLASQRARRQGQLQQANSVGLIAGGMLLEGGAIDAEGTQQIDAYRATMEAAADTSVHTAQVIEGAFKGMSDALGEALVVAIIHGERLDRVFKQGAASMIESLSVQAMQQSLYLLATLPAASILFPGVGPAKVLAAAGTLAAFSLGAAGVSAALGGGARGQGGGRGGRGGAAGAGGGFSAPRAARAPEPNGQGGNTTIVLRLGFSRSEAHDAVIDEANSRLGLNGRPRVVVA